MWWMDLTHYPGPHDDEQGGHAIALDDYDSWSAEWANEWPEDNSAWFLPGTPPPGSITVTQVGVNLFVDKDGVQYEIRGGYMTPKTVQSGDTFTVNPGAITFTVS